MLAIMVVSAGFVATACADDKAREDRVALQGTWISESLEAMGQPARASEVWEFLVKGNQISLKTQGQVAAVVTFKLDPTLDPRLIDWTFTEGGPNGQTWEGIYALDGDTLKLCIARTERERPTAFVTKPDVNCVLIVLKRQKQ
jgi:uncharacterized protein (TIGR03067 family)